ncbi:MAG: hypothetical protein KC635_20440, partial [Myxococcales bacterium]|nr:hypothetical protein [Myxococcales bacterium]
MKATKGWVAAAMGVVWLALGACGEDTTGSPAEDTLDAVLLFDTSLLADADAVGFDTLPPVDTADVDAGGDVDTIVFGDGTAGTDGGDADVSGCGGGFGCPCQQNGDCLDERCVESVDGRVCTKRCTTECPDGFDCVTTSALGDPESLCIPRHTRLCRPCRADAECQNPFDDAPGYCVAASDPDQGSFCGSSCAGGRQCPEGYQCASVATKGGGTALQCVISEGMCACRPAWDGLGYTTSCAVRNGLGACEGTRGCGELGLTPCVGPQATPEICNDVDDDCNGATDDIAATPCLVQNLFGACPGTLACGAGQTPVCQGEGAEPEACDGVDNDCNGTTDEAGCDDGLPCTVDSCDAPFQCGHVLAGGFCAISGACYAAGTPKPGDACSVCDPGRATTSWSSATGTCLIAGQCYAANAVNPANACQVCDPGQSGTGWSQAQSTCLIQGQCYAAGAQKPGQSCLRCVPEQNPSGWTAAASTTSCDDGNPCSTDDHCDGGGTCVGDTSCNDGVACTTDQCTATGCNHSGVPTGWCRIGQACYTTGTANPSNPCQRCLSATSQTTWSAQPTSVACSDGSACTAGDHCDGAGACAPGPGCSDGLSCTTDTCNPAVGCSYPTASGRCKISDA